MTIYDLRLVESNPQWESIDKFLGIDKHLKDINNSKFIFDYKLDQEIISEGVYLLYAGRQIGKTTSLKQFIKKEILEKKVKSTNTIYINCDLFTDRKELEISLREFFNEIDRAEPNIVIIDEVCGIKEWQLTIKAIIDLGWTANSKMVLTGSDRILLEDGAKGFPGVNRRGISGRDIQLFPLQFKEFVNLISKEFLSEPNRYYLEIENLFNDYLKVGGYLSAINLFYKDSSSLKSAYMTYQQWITSDFTRKNKDKNKLIDLLRVIIERYGSQISYSKLSNESLGLSTETVINYIDHLERLDILITLQAYDQNKRAGYPKKERRFHFTDPFIANAILHLLQKEKALSEDFKFNEAQLVESVVIANYRRENNKLYYIKAEGEVDLVIPEDKGFLPIEVKWTERLKESELKQVLKYENGIILSKNLEVGKIYNATTRNLIFELLNN